MLYSEFNTKCFEALTERLDSEKGITTEDMEAVIKELPAIKEAESN